ncbi:MAG: hypothetical protein V7K67_23650 [Nostoc sp.]
MFAGSAIAVKSVLILPLLPSFLKRDRPNPANDHRQLTLIP